MPHVSGLMLGNMLQIVTKAHGSETTLSRANVMHPIRTMTNMKTDDEELNCIALGHDLMNSTDVTLNELVHAGMTDRVLTGLILLRDATTIEETLDNICQTDDTMRVALACLLDRKALCNVTTKNKNFNEYCAYYLRISNYMRDIETCATLGLKRPIFSSNSC